MAGMSRWRHALLALPVIVAACALAVPLRAPVTQDPADPVRVVERARSGPPAVRGPAALRAAMLAGHNRARRAVGVAPLDWDETLAAAAAGYAADMARSGRFRHSAARGMQGENLFTGTRGAYSYGEMVALWVGERRDFANGTFPDVSRSGRWSDVAHYTQIVWRDTTRVGCALASGARDDYLVCRYGPAGNVVGRRVF